MSTRFKLQLRFRKIGDLGHQSSSSRASHFKDTGKVSERGLNPNEAKDDTRLEEMMRGIRMAALAVIMTLAFSGLGLARDHDDDDHWRPHRDRHHDWDRDRGHGRWRD